MSKVKRVIVDGVDITKGVRAQDRRLEVLHARDAAARQRTLKRSEHQARRQVKNLSRERPENPTGVVVLPTFRTKIGGRFARLPSQRLVREALARQLAAEVVE